MMLQIGPHLCMFCKMCSAACMMIVGSCILRTVCVPDISVLYCGRFVLYTNTGLWSKIVHKHHFFRTNF
jgi:hypothetical protein